jgi:hypothetical protein
MGCRCKLSFQATKEAGQLGQREKMAWTVEQHKVFKSWMNAKVAELQAEPSPHRWLNGNVRKRSKKDCWHIAHREWCIKGLKNRPEFLALGSDGGWEE